MQEGFVVEAGQLDAVGQVQPGGKPENPPDVVGTAQADACLQGGMPVVLQKERYTSQKCLRGTDRISNVAWEVGAILQPEKESFAFR